MKHTGSNSGRSRRLGTALVGPRHLIHSESELTNLFRISKKLLNYCGILSLACLTSS